jgi:hypothetical protein
MRGCIIALKRNRRVSVGTTSPSSSKTADGAVPDQEMVRTERIVDDPRIQEEIDAYNALLPGPGELSATLFIEIPDLARMSNEEVRRTINRFQGLDRGGVVGLRMGARPPIPARFEEGHSKEEKLAAVHYLRFAVPGDAEDALSDPREPVRLVVDHAHYQAEADVPPATRAELLADLRA